MNLKSVVLPLLLRILKAPSPSVKKIHWWLQWNHDDAVVHKCEKGWQEQVPVVFAACCWCPDVWEDEENCTGGEAREEAATCTEVATDTPLGTQKERLPSGAANVCVGWGAARQDRDTFNLGLSDAEVAAVWRPLGIIKNSNGLAAVIIEAPIASLGRGTRAVYVLADLERLFSNPRREWLRPSVGLIHVREAECQGPNCLPGERYRGRFSIHFLWTSAMLRCSSDKRGQRLVFQFINPHISKPAIP